MNSLEKRTVTHAYIFSGPRGTGKTTTARILAKSLNCINTPFSEPCNECASCKAIDTGSHLDVVELDAASNRGIEEVRKIRDGVNFAPAMGRYKVYIIDEVHMLTREAFNALLKTLEEPPSHVVFVLATTNPEKIPPTITSRCQVLEFKNISSEEIAMRLREVSNLEGFDVSEEALTKIARRASGGLRDALSILEQVVRFTGGEVDARAVDEALGLVAEETVVSFLEALSKGDRSRIEKIVEEIYLQKGDFDTFCSQLIDYALADGSALMLNLASEVYRIKRELRGAEEKLLIAKLLFVLTGHKFLGSERLQPIADKKSEASSQGSSEHGSSESSPENVGMLQEAPTGTENLHEASEPAGMKGGSLVGQNERTALNVANARESAPRVTDQLLEELKLKGDLSIFVGLSLARIYEDEEMVRIVFDESKQFSYELIKERIEEVKMLYRNKSSRFRDVRVELAPASSDPVLEKLKMLLGEPEER